MTSNSARDIDHAPGKSGSADGFLWDHRGAPVQSAPARAVAPPEARPADVIDVTAVPEHEPVVPDGMFNQWPLEVLLHITKPFTGLVVLIDLISFERHSSHGAGILQSVTALVAGMLGENEFGCRTTEDEFVMICPGQQGAQAQRRLNQLSEQLWQFQQRGHGTFSILFSWGGIGAPDRPLSEAIADAVQRMNHLNRNRKINSTESVNHRRKVV